MARQDVIDLLREQERGEISEDQLLRYLDQVEASYEDLEEAEIAIAEGATT